MLLLLCVSTIMYVCVFYESQSLSNRTRDFACAHSIYAVGDISRSPPPPPSKLQSYIALVIINRHSNLMTPPIIIIHQLVWYLNVFDWSFTYFTLMPFVLGVESGGLCLRLGHCTVPNYVVYPVYVQGIHMHLAC